jgi:hypothetical protein
MASSEIVKDFLAHLEPDDVPFEYISAASIKDLDGQEVILKGAELEKLMNNHPNYAYVKDARVYINLQKVIKAITIEVEYIFEMVDLLFYEEQLESENKEDDSSSA